MMPNNSKALVFLILCALACFFPGSAKSQGKNFSKPTPSQPFQEQPSGKKELLSRIKQRMDSVREKMKSLQQTAPMPLEKTHPKPDRIFKQTTIENPPATLNQASFGPVPPDRSDLSTDPEWSDNSSGFYLLPFASTFTSKKAEWQPKYGNAELDQEYGYGGGVRMGYGWTNVYMELKVAYLKNDLSPGKIGGFDIKGHFSGLSTLMHMGLKFPLSHHTTFTIGGGAGASHQEAKLFVGSLAVEEQSLTPTYCASTGFEFRPFEHLLFGIHYHWYNMDEFYSFSDRDIHALEISFGYFQ